LEESGGGDAGAQEEAKVAEVVPHHEVVPFFVVLEGARNVSWEVGCQGVIHVLLSDALEAGPDEVERVNCDDSWGDHEVTALHENVLYLMQVHPNSLGKLALSISEWVHGLIDGSHHEVALGVDPIIECLCIESGTLNWCEEAVEEFIGLLVDGSLQVCYLTNLCALEEDFAESLPYVLAKVEELAVFVCGDCLANFVKDVRAIHDEALADLPNQGERVREDFSHLREDLKVILNGGAILEHSGHELDGRPNLVESGLDPIKGGLFKVGYRVNDGWLNLLTITDAGVKRPFGDSVLQNPIEYTLNDADNV
jgi:hypothetical protein